MTSRETYAAYRQMTPDQRLALTLRAIRAATPYLGFGSPDVVARRFARLRHENDARNRALLERLADAVEAHERR